MFFRKSRNNIRQPDPPLPSAAQQLGCFLGCSWERVDPSLSCAQITDLFLTELAAGASSGTHPMLITADDLLLETIEENCEDNGGAAAYREKLMQLPCDRLPDWMKNPMKPYAGTFKPQPPLNELICVTQNNLRQGEELMLVRLPVSEPCRVFAHLPFGSWNDCPDAEDLIAVCKDWQTRYGAVPAMLSHDILQMYVPQPLTDPAEAMRLASEHFTFCEDLSQGIGTIGALADSLIGSHFWFFWWD